MKYEYACGTVFLTKHNGMDKYVIRILTRILISYII